jgi:uncharacterized protein YjbI with pentapeptide repeats
MQYRPLCCLWILRLDRASVIPFHVSLQLSPGPRRFGANLSGAHLSEAVLIQTDLRDASLAESQVYGASVWDIKVNDQTKQQNLIITPYADAAITIDNIKVAQFIYLFLNNQEIRDVIDTITSKASVNPGPLFQEAD